MISIIRSIDKTLDRREVICTVTDKGIKNYSGSGLYLIYGEDSENICVYEISDSLLLKRFNSSDVYTDIKIGNTYKFNIGGHRNYFFSWYPNIYTYKILEENIE